MPVEFSHPIETLLDDFKKLTCPKDIAELLEVDYSRLIYHLHKVPASNKYTVFTISKKSGGVRRITSPISPLKILQRKLNHILSNCIEPKHSAHGFVSGRSIRTNTLVHSNKKYVFTVDLLEFLPSINFGRVRGLFMAPPFKFNAGVATVLAQLCVFKNALPQGAPTSPVISNLICRKMDQQLSRLARNYGCNYTRYADDLTFSTKREIFPKVIGVRTPDTKGAYPGEELNKIILSHGFSVHPKKVRLLHCGQQQIVTGLVANKFPNVRRKYLRQVRAILHAADRYGFPAAEAEFYAKHYKDKHLNPSRGKPSLKTVLKGKIDFIGMVRGKLDPVYLSMMMKLQRLDQGLVKRIPSPGWIAEIGSALFVIDFLTGKGTHEQGTGFVLKGVGLVTCAHVLGVEREVYQAFAPNRKYYVEIVASNKDLDVAILKIVGFSGRELVLGDDDAVRVDSEIILAGFPNYAPGHSGSIKRGRIVANYLHMGKKRFLIDAAIVSGNSGGPVLDNKMRVVGIAARGYPRMQVLTQPIGTA